MMGDDTVTVALQTNEVTENDDEDQRVLQATDHHTELKKTKQS